MKIGQNHQGITQVDLYPMQRTCSTCGNARRTISASVLYHHTKRDDIAHNLSLYVENALPLPNEAGILLCVTAECQKVTKGQLRSRLAEKDFPSHLCIVGLRFFVASR